MDSYAQQRARIVASMAKYADGPRNHQLALLDAWDRYERPAWVPDELWGEALSTNVFHRRTPQEWIDGHAKTSWGAQGAGPLFGALVGAGGDYIPHIGVQPFTVVGRFVGFLNNMGRIVAHDGTWRVCSFGSNWRNGLDPSLENASLDSANL